MNGYSKMRVRSTPKSRSMDLTGLSFSPSQAQHHDPDPPPPKPQAHHHHSPIEEEDGERFGVILSRNCSSASRRFRGNENNEEKQINTSTLHAVVRRAFSMRKSRSVGDGYWRIHDTGDGDGDGDAEGIHEEDEVEMPTRIKKRGSFFRACKRLFKFSS